MKNLFNLNSRNKFHLDTFSQFKSFCSNLLIIPNTFNSSDLSTIQYKQSLEKKKESTKQNKQIGRTERYLSFDQMIEVQCYAGRSTVKIYLGYQWVWVPNHVILLKFGIARLAS